jgi:uncharacterized protein YndB with AHSA1/START domain
VRQVTVETVISAPREAVFDFVGDLSLRPSFADHYLKDYRLANANPVGRGAAARFLLDSPVFSERGGLQITEYDRPRRIVEEGGVGRRGRSRLVAVYDFTAEAGGNTRVELTTFSEPGNWVDRIKQTGVHRWVRRQTKKALRRLKQRLEQPGREELERVTVAGYESVKAPRFGGHVPVDHETAPADG